MKAATPTIDVPSTASNQPGWNMRSLVLGGTEANGAWLAMTLTSSK